MKTNYYISSGTFAKLGSSKANIFVTRYKIVTAEKEDPEKLPERIERSYPIFLTSFILTLSLPNSELLLLCALLKAESSNLCVSFQPSITC